MRDFEKPGRSEALGMNGMVSTSNPQATLAGLDVLKAGGNAIDAAITAAAILAVVEPTQTGIGGDCFVLLKKKGAKPIALNGSGWSPAAASLEFYQERGITTLDSQSAHAVTIPGSLRAWERLAEDHGTFEWKHLLQPAIHIAEHGYPVTERLARDWALQVNKMSKTSKSASIFLPGGKAPVAGQVFQSLLLANALKSIAEQGAQVFYEGWIAEDIVSTLKREGGLHQLDDFAEYQPDYVTPISAQYRGYDLWECPPNGSGVVALAIATLLNQFDLARYQSMSFERFHLHAEVARLAYAERDLFLCDPTFNDIPIDYLLSAQRASKLASKIGFQHRLEDLTPMPIAEHRDTVFLSVVDREGMVVSFINSIFDDFGSGIIAPASGILLHNRANGFVLEAGHPNALGGRKRPMHTIIPAILTKGNDAVMSFGATGVHFQPTGQLQILSNIIDYGMSVQQAIDYPRMFARGDNFELESTVPESIADALRAVGHKPIRTTHPLGSSQAIWIDTRGVLHGGADPRRDGIALGY